MNQGAYILPASGSLFRHKRADEMLAVYIKVTLLFLLFLFAGLFLYALLTSVLYPYRCSIVDSFFGLQRAYGDGGILDLLHGIFDSTRWERYLLVAGIAAAFSFFCPAISYVFTVFCGAATGAAIGYIRYAVATAEYLPQDLVCFIVFRAICSAVILHFFARAIMTSRQIYYTQERAVSLACRLILQKLWQALLCYMFIFAASLCFVFIL